MNYSYTGSVVGVTIKKAGTYKLEVWGAQGATGAGYSGNHIGNGGYGGYSYGTKSLSTGSTIYVTIGGQGNVCTVAGCIVNGGYNGGGSGCVGNMLSQGVKC